MTALAGRLLLDGLEEAVDCSREDAGGVRCSGELRSGALSCFKALTLMSWISTRSSSSPGLNAPVPFDVRDVSAATFSDHVPSGSIVTCSTEGLVFLRISSTYLLLVRRAQNVAGDSLVDLQPIEGSRALVANWAGPSRGLFLQLQKRGGVKALIVRTNLGATWNLNPQS
jgi:hypothetical protein